MTVQDYLNIELDSHRNQLIQLELVLTAAMFALALITAITGIFGMNLNNTHENSYSAFVWVSRSLLLDVLYVCVLSLAATPGDQTAFQHSSLEVCEPSTAGVGDDVRGGRASFHCHCPVLPVRLPL